MLRRKKGLLRKRNSPQSVDKPRFDFIAAFTPHFVFPLTRAAEKHLISEKPLNKRFFKGTGVVLAGIECRPKITDFRANGIPVLERVKKA